MSSRNAYLSPEQRSIAAKLNAVMRETIARLRQGADIAGAETDAVEALKQAGFDCVDYVAVRDACTLEPITALDTPARILVAAWLGKTRLIDNMAI
jgi:pantoate--beta-alanine ligase